MTYDDIAAAFLVPPAEPLPAPDVPASPARRLRDAVEPIATLGWWSRPAAERVERTGAGFFPGYVWGRAAALGADPSPEVVISAFGVFEPSMLAAVLAVGRQATDRTTILAARADGAAEALAAVVSEREAEALAAPLLAALGTLDTLARPLFGGLRSLQVPSSAAGRLWRAAELVREHRGDGHLAAVAASGLDVVEANVCTELWLGFGVGEYSATRGFGPEVIAAGVQRLTARGWVADGALTPEGRSARTAVEDATDRSQDALLRALGDDAERVVEGCTAIGARLLAARACPADPRKRAAG